MNRNIHKMVLSAVTVSLVVCLFLPVKASAWFQNYPVAPYYSPTPYYSSGPPAFAAWPGVGQGYYGYTQPQWYIHGYVNRYGDYRLDIKLRNVSQYDLYKAWLLYQYYSQH